MVSMSSLSAVFTVLYNTIFPASLATETEMRYGQEERFRVLENQMEKYRSLAHDVETLNKAHAEE